MVNFPLTAGAVDPIVWPIAAPLARVAELLRIDLAEVTEAAERVAPFADVLRFNPWHSRPEHKPLGNSNRARRRMYWELARLRQGMNSVEHVEPTGDEIFPGSHPSPSAAR